MSENEKALLQILESDECDYEKCRQIIRQIGGCTAEITDKYGFRTNPLFEAVNFGHYDFAGELIFESGADLDAISEIDGPLIWELQYLEDETEEQRWQESARKLRLIRQLIKAGANPNPKYDGEEYLHHLTFELGEGISDYPQKLHIWAIEHIVEAHAYNRTEHFFAKLKEQAIRRIFVSDWGFTFYDDNLCECDYAVFEFEDGEKMLLSSYMVDDEEWDFYAVSANKLIKPSYEKLRVISSTENAILFESRYDGEMLESSHWLDFSIDDAVLRFHADELTLSIGVTSRESGDWMTQKRQSLFIS